MAVGDFASGKDLGLDAGKYGQRRYVWSQCPTCDKEWWRSTASGNHSIQDCRSCLLELPGVKELGEWVLFGLHTSDDERYIISEGRKGSESGRNS
jgi:hypothetical protein